MYRTHRVGAIDCGRRPSNVIGSRGVTSRFTSPFFSEALLVRHANLPPG
jgi:hypothetical protein